MMFVNVFFNFIKMCQDKVKTLEIELDEEKTGAELLNERATRSREQVHRRTVVKGCFLFVIFMSASTSYTQARILIKKNF